MSETISREAVVVGASAGAAVLMLLKLSGLLTSRRSKAGLGPKSKQNDNKYILHVYDVRMTSCMY